MRAVLKVYGKKPTGGRFRLRHGISPVKDRRELQNVDGQTFIVEDPGWPDDRWYWMIVETAPPDLGADEIVLDNGNGDTTWQPTQGLKGRFARALTRLGVTEGASTMNGSVFEGVVVRTTKVPAGKQSDVDKSEVVYVQKPFVARDEATASGLILAAATKEASLDVNDPAAPVEVKLRKY